jgi:hypothetical protein
MMIWDVEAMVQGGAVVSTVAGETEAEAEKLFRRMASGQGVEDRDVIVGSVTLCKEPEQLLVESQTVSEKTEMVARVRQGAEMLAKLAATVAEAEYAGADVRLLLKAVEEAQSLLVNGADAVERGETEE